MRIAVGDYPTVSPSGKYVAYNPCKSDGVGIFEKFVHVVELKTGRTIVFDSIPKNTHIYPGSAWSSDEKLITFCVHDFDGSYGSRCIVSMVDGSFWRGTEDEFEIGYGRLFQCETESTQIFVEEMLSEPKVGLDNPGCDCEDRHANGLFYHLRTGLPIRLTRTDMLVDRAVWIEPTREILFTAQWHEDYRAARPWRIYLINPEAKDWRNLSRRAWNAAVIGAGDDISGSRDARLCVSR
jgi:transposase